jgi:chromosome segregation ATPase
MSDLDRELEEVIKKRKRLQADLDRLRGRKEQAEASLTAVEKEIRSKGIEPSEIDEKLRQLEEKYEALVEELRNDTEAAERALAPFVGGSEADEDRSSQA